MNNRAFFYLFLLTLTTLFGCDKNNNTEVLSLPKRTLNIVLSNTDKPVQACLYLDLPHEERLKTELNTGNNLLQFPKGLPELLYLKIKEDSFPIWMEQDSVVLTLQLKDSIWGPKTADQNLFMQSKRLDKLVVDLSSQLYASKQNGALLSNRDSLDRVLEQVKQDKNELITLQFQKNDLKSLCYLYHNALQLKESEKLEQLLGKVPSINAKSPYFLALKNRIFLWKKPASTEDLLSLSFRDATGNSIAPKRTNADSLVLFYFWDYRMQELEINQQQIIAAQKEHPDLKVISICLLEGKDGLPIIEPLKRNKWQNLGLLKNKSDSSMLKLSLWQLPKLYLLKEKTMLQSLDSAAQIQ